MKTFSLNQIKDEMIGEMGSPKRDKYELKLKLDIARESIIAILEKHKLKK